MAARGSRVAARTAVRQLRRRRQPPPHEVRIGGTSRRRQLVAAESAACAASRTWRRNTDGGCAATSAGGGRVITRAIAQRAIDQVITRHVLSSWLTPGVNQERKNMRS